ncbi:hypothetical protein C3747_225g31 [Trypanosoma cruzi]|uniref:Uncharacterized protein n=2 Tax=Trypanosoma cruzi TaxID=5693 RepID=Q4E318_TRYCC|nr:hypothetical protein, conserved [Trypanosoma cruzi]EAN99158.1 hypothetical protein, conserved [Trypanosoma cruzi]PWU98872.1 hypothetical protein C3747_225g31 [Trypanosoma cruzi]|eukprot:XP_821009.1 hypothetical protein [Trypanosoma cruzi strain CL Brener]
MEIIDRPLSELIKEQKIGESLRKKRRGHGGQQNTRNGGRGTSRNGRGNRAMGRGSRGTAGNDQGRRYRRPLRFRSNGGRFRRLGIGFDDRRGFNSRSWRRNALDLGDDRRDRSVKSTATQRRRKAAFERNDRVRELRRREALSRARSRFSRD